MSFRKVPQVTARSQPMNPMVAVVKSQRIFSVLKWMAFAVTCSILSFQACPNFTTILQRPPRALSPRFAIDFESDSFMLAGESVRILSGSVHYFRTPRELWMERLTYAHAAGLNTIDTSSVQQSQGYEAIELRMLPKRDEMPLFRQLYFGAENTRSFVEWSSHEPEEGRFDFHGQSDLGAFLEMAHNLSLMVILRPGPYIGAERDMGGLPYWLLRKDPAIRLRTMDATYTKFADRYLREVFKRVRHLLVRNGGPIIMVQVESRYGMYSECNRTYLRHLRDMMRQELGSDTVLFATDRVGVGTMPCGRVEGVFPAIAFGAAANVSEVFATQRLYQKRGPLFVSELYTGWFDRWSMPHQHVNHALVASALSEVLLAGASVNLYMFHGGTSFGFSTGASGRKADVFYRPQVTSYDFGGLLTEAGDPTKLFVAVRRIISELFPNKTLPEVPKRKRKMKFGPIKTMHMFGIAGLQYIARGHSVPSEYPLTFEQMGHAHGLMFYDTIITYQPHEHVIFGVEGIRDGGYVYLDGVFVDSLSHAENNTALLIKAKEHQVLTILVHNEGRISSGNGLSESKGIVSNVTLDKNVLTNWTMKPIPLANASWLTDYDELRSIRKQVSSKAVSSPYEVRVLAAKFELPSSEPYDTFLRPDQKTKGIAFLNGFNLGRYWPARGPQKTLYVPRTLFRRQNLLVLIELEGAFHRAGKPPVVHFEDKPELDGTAYRMDE